MENKSNSEDRVSKIIVSIKDYLKNSLAPEEIILFGSRAKGNFKRGSDIDIAVKGGRELTHREERKLKEKIDEISGLYSVDIVFWEKLDKDFKKKLKNSGEILYGKS
ncbi:MAG: nucleotidyltransferase domain-containing protein [Elusimicrobia bacterium]|nr:nucleotidyltransferase domain-containing protein [Elusimicrobiota bacterium]